MKNRKNPTLLWLGAGFLLSALALAVVLTGLSGKTWVTDPESIPETVNQVMLAVQSGDWNALEALVYGNPPLSPATGAENTAEKAIWNAYQQSLVWSCSESYEVQGPCVTQQISVTCLDIAGVTQAMAENLPGRPVEEEEVLCAVEAVLASDPPMLQRNLTMTFRRSNGHWQLLPDNAFKLLLSGFTSS